MISRTPAAKPTPSCDRPRRRRDHRSPRDAPEEQPGDPRPTVRPEDDQVGSRSAGGSDDLGGGAALSQLGVGFAAGVLEVMRHGSGQLVALAADGCGSIEVQGHAFGRPWFREARPPRCPEVSHADDPNGHAQEDRPVADQRGGTTGTLGAVPGQDNPGQRCRARDQDGHAGPVDGLG